MSMDWTPEQIDRCAAAAHYAYESAALDAGWETNPASRVPWNDVPASNKAATRAAAAAVLSAVDLSDHDRAVAADARAEGYRDGFHEGMADEAIFCCNNRGHAIGSECMACVRLRELRVRAEAGQ